MTKKTILVTGGNKGIGQEITKQLASRGHTVYFSARDAEKGQETLQLLSQYGDVRLIEIDLRKPNSHHAAFAELQAQTGKLDGLINNAAICTDYEGPATVTLDALRMHFETNYFGVVSLTQAMLPLLRAGDHKTIVNVSTALGSLGLQGEESWPYSAVNLLAYNSSKTALNMFTVSLAKELRSEGFRINAVNPGHIKTGLGGDQAPGSVEEGAAISVKCVLAGPESHTGLFLSSGGVVPW